MKCYLYRCVSYKQLYSGRKSFWTFFSPLQSMSHAFKHLGVLLLFLALVWFGLAYLSAGRYLVTFYHMVVWHQNIDSGGRGNCPPKHEGSFRPKNWEETYPFPPHPATSLARICFKSQMSLSLLGDREYPRGWFLTLIFPHGVQGQALPEPI